MPKQQVRKTKPEDLGIKFGSDDMVYWRNMIDNKKEDIRITKENLRFFEFIVENAEKEYQKAEEEFEKNRKSPSMVN